MRLSKSEKIYKIVCYTVAITIALVSLYPLLYTLFVSLCSEKEWLARNGILLFFPSNPTLEGYAKVFASGMQVVQSMGISLARSVLGMVLGVFFNVCVGYAVSRENLPGRKGIMAVLMATVLFGAGTIPAYLTIKEVGLLNSFWSMVLPCVVSAWNILIFKQCFEGMPKELEDAAKIDGCGEFKLMTKIIVPLAKPTMAAISLFTFVGHWNSWFDAMLYIDSQHADKWPLQLFTMITFNNMAQINGNEVDLNFLIQSQGVSQISQKMALTIVTLLPILIAYPFFQKYFTKGVYAGAVKG